METNFWDFLIFIVDNHPWVIFCLTPALLLVLVGIGGVLFVAYRQGREIELGLSKVRIGEPKENTGINSIIAASEKFLGILEEIQAGRVEHIHIEREKDNYRAKAMSAFSEFQTSADYFMKSEERAQLQIFYEQFSRRYLGAFRNEIDPLFNLVKAVSARAKSKRGKF